MDLSLEQSGNSSESASKVLVSVCIANYNGEAVLIDCIESVLAQRGEIPTEIIIHDDASTDASLELIKTQYPATQYPHIRVIESAENVGFCISNNRMVEVAQGEYILLLNNDAALAPDALKTFFYAAEKQIPKGVLGLPQFDWETGKLVDQGYFLDPFYNPVPNFDTTVQDVAMIIGACFWIPRTLWQELGGFPAWFESIAEDTYLCCRARLAGYPVQVVQGSHFRHRQGASFGGNGVRENKLITTYRRRRLSEINKTYVMLLCSPPFRLALTLPLHILLMTVEGGVISIINRDFSPWRIIYAPLLTDVWKFRMEILAGRLSVQSTRVASACEFSRAFRFVPRKIIMLIKHGFPRIE
ncbi:MAG: glycosyltransferase family 2 protein [Halothiobacillus sp.]